ncbi:MAG TPA: carboxypeptidase M32 [Candidatus Methylacidiphilales bacterium]|jgi:carboxypeptidase Taq|nr:carboxypeptidase M32 [Candidatus Methylacidiphilales bacterium]
MNAYESLQQRSREIAAYSSAASLLSWDQETHMPPKAGAYRAEQLSRLAGLTHGLGTSADVGDWIASCEGHLPPGADEEEKALRAANVREWRRDYDRATKLPARLVEDLARTTSLAREAWAHARHESNFAAFAPWLEKILRLAREQAECWGYADCAYDALLEGYEPGARAAGLAPVFADLQKQLTPLLPRLQKITGGIDPARIEGEYSVSAQQALNRRIAGAMGFDLDAGRIDTTVHPFCTETGPKDCRLTTRYNERDFTSSLFGVMHEAGHGLYTQGLPPDQFGAPMGSAVSLGIHESQSRLWENQVGRSREFWRCWYPRAIETFPGLAALPPDEFWLLVNRVEPTHIRVEADEATYNLHIILRFEIEQKLVSGELPVADLPRAWNARFEELFGIPVPDDARGCLQDTHWALGLIGYFPTYTLGTLNAAQLFAAALKQAPGLDADLREAQYGGLLAWLRKNIHRHGRRYSPSGLIERATGEPPCATYFIDYLRAKYGL